MLNMNKNKPLMTRPQEGSKTTFLNQTFKAGIGLLKILGWGFRKYRIQGRYPILQTKPFHSLLSRIFLDINRFTLYPLHAT